VKTLALILTAALACTPALAQQRPDWKGKHQGTSRDDRERMRQDMRDAYRDRDRQQERPQRQMSPQERERLRQDIDDANRRLKK